MQQENLRLRALRVGALPILNSIIARIGLAEELQALIKNMLVERNALYAVGEWAALYDAGLVAQSRVGDDKLGRALDRLFAADRATLQTRIVLAVMNGFDLKMEQIHNDTTSVMVRGAYDGQNAKAVQLRQGHSKEHRPDLKQLVYSLCVTRDGAVPAHFKAYDGNQTDDGIHLETWSRIRTLLQHPRFIYVADCKLCTEKNLRTIDSERGFFVTIVPKTRSEVATFSEAALAGDVRWEEILRKRADRNEKAFDVVECAVGPHHLREGFTLHWYRSSQKKKRDERDRDERIERARERLETLDLRRRGGPRRTPRFASVLTRFSLSTMPRSGSRLRSSGTRSRSSRPPPAASRRRTPRSVASSDRCRACISAPTLQTLRDRRPWMGSSH